MSTKQHPDFPIALAGTRAETLMWANPYEVEHDAQTQLRNAAAMPWVAGVRAMPDIHTGYGVPVGSVVAMRQAVSPSAVGVDIGCGMMAVKTNIKTADLPDYLGPMRSAIEAAVPVGFNGHNGSAAVLKQDKALGSAFDRLFAGFKNLHAEKMADREGKAISQCGSLGSGNHFIEVTHDEDGTVWLMLHSGSRNAGKEIAERHIDIAKGLGHNNDVENVLPDRNLAVFLSGTKEMDEYLHDLYWAQDYAMMNRRIMMASVKRVFDSFFTDDVSYTDDVNCLAGETLVLTDRGLSPIQDLAGASHTLLTTGGEWVKAPVKSFGRQRLWEITIGRFGEEKTLRATANHRWLLRRKVAHFRDQALTAELRVGDRLDYAFPRRPENLATSTHGIARGFVFGDGSVSGRTSGSCANFCGAKDEALLPHFEGMGVPREYLYIREGEIARYVKVGDQTEALRSDPRAYVVKRLGGLPREWKTEYPSLDGSNDDLYGWLAGYFAADGEVGKTGRPAIWSAAREDLEFFKRACDVLGIWTLPIRKHTRKGYGGAFGEVFVMGISRADLDEAFFIHEAHRERWVRGRGAVERRGWTVRAVRETDAVDEVFCAVVEGTHAFTLEGNILTGNCHHNYVAEEEYAGERLVVTRKGAIFAGRGARACIPGSMGTGSYIVRGKGNEASYNSASHGAGRKMSRSKAKKMFTVEDLAAQTKGVECRKDQGVVDEIPGAYKDLESVIAAQVDLVEVEARLTTLLCVKG